MANLPSLRPLLARALSNVTHRSTNNSSKQTGSNWNKLRPNTYESNKLQRTDSGTEILVPLNEIAVTRTMEVNYTPYSPSDKSRRSGDQIGLAKSIA